jgi:DNA-binding response OmpR family regulator
MTIDKILMIIDDDKDDRFFFCNAVKQIAHGWTCLEAKDAEHALEDLKIMEPLPDFIFLDLNMSRMDGKECLVELKRDKRLSNIPVIIYSTSSYEEDMELTFKLGAVYYMVKEPDIYKLPRNITTAIKIAEETIANLKTASQA